MRNEFPCDKCGICCQNLHLSDMFTDLDDGTGTCIYFDSQSKLCTIYDNRPEKCNVEKMYKYYSTFLTYEEYIYANIEACRILKEGAVNGQNFRRESTNKL